MGERVVPKLTPEFKVSDIGRSVGFYSDVLGFRVLYERREERFAYLDREGAELMLEQDDELAELAGEFMLPLGRGVHLQIEVSDVESLRESIRGRSHIQRPLRQVVSRQRHFARKPAILGI